MDKEKSRSFDPTLDNQTLHIIAQNSVVKLEYNGIPTLLFQRFYLFLCLPVAILASQILATIHHSSTVFIWFLARNKTGCRYCINKYARVQSLNSPYLPPRLNSKHHPP